ncbi:protein NDH-DEPENDENT CYCLIC ELECTRON FLOW 5 [Silene latifolia]|uniref:protein NDH-DEPENDENT CYCLIC ELECTRON FLOW 5 n=1 Tax=Silene latifolia TaxID=37657 RepID=UPI003D7728D1
MSSNLLFSSKTLPLNKPKHSSIPSLFPFTSTPQCINFNNRREITPPITVNSPYITSYPQSENQPSFNVDYLQTEFGCHGVAFKDLGQSYVIKMVVENGSAASVVLPAGLVTSYKPKMWHGSSVEVLHTSVTQDPAGTPVILGGVSPFLEVFNDEGFSWCPVNWVLNGVHGSCEESEDSIQVEMISRDVRKTVEVKHILTLKDDTLISEINISNLKSSQLKIRGSILSHLVVSTPEATYALGLEGSNFYDREPLNSNFCIIPPPDIRKSTTSTSRQAWSLKELFSAKKEEIEVTEGEEDESYKHLTNKMSRIYTYAPRNFTIMDRGKRNSVSVGRKGFEEVYLYSPGSSHESYGKYSYICVGQSALLKPLSLGPHQIWTGQQILHNPNL